LDEKYFTGQKRKINSASGRHAGSPYLALPVGANLWSYEDNSPHSHPRIKEDQQVVATFSSSPHLMSEGIF
jgi:hypothetical protein